MGKVITAQKRGKGAPRYIANKKGVVSISTYKLSPGRAQVIDFIDDPAHSALLVKLLLEDGSIVLLPASEGLKINEEIPILDSSTFKFGAIQKLADIPDGCPVFNIELRPGGGGVLARSSGSVAYVVSHEENGYVKLKLPSKKVKLFSENCMAIVGLAAGGGRKEKPFVRAGNKYFAMRARNKLYPTVRGLAKCAYAHPHGGKSGKTKGKPTSISRFASRGQKTGHIRSATTGKRKGKRR